MPAARAVVGKHTQGFCAQRLRRGEQGRRIEIALQRDAAADGLAGLGKIRGPIHADGIAADGCDPGKPCASPLREHDVRDPAALRYPRQRVDHLGHVVQGEFRVLCRRQHSAPGIEQHHRLRAGGNLRIEIQDGGLGEYFEQSVQIARRLVHHALDAAEGLAAAAFNHVSAHGPRAPGEADQRHSAAEFAANQRHRVHHVPDLPRRIRRADFVDIRRSAHRTLEFRALAGFEFQS